MQNLYQICDDTLILTLQEELDHHMTERIRDPIDRIIIQNRIRFIVIDFTKQGFMDSSGIGFIMGRYKRLTGLHGKVFVTNLGRNLERIFRVSGLFLITTQVESVDEAMEQVRGGLA